MPVAEGTFRLAGVGRLDVPEPGPVLDGFATGSVWLTCEEPGAPSFLVSGCGLFGLRHCSEEADIGTGRGGLADLLFCVECQVWLKSC